MENNNTWAKNYNILFIDQPVGTGLSYADISYKKSPFVMSMEGKLYKYKNRCCIRFLSWIKLAI